MPLFILIIAFFTSTLTAFCVDTEADLGVGYRQDALTWQFSGPGGNPNILSELEWKDLLSCEFSGTFNIRWQSYQLQASGNYARICDGYNWDADYFGNNRTELFSLSRSKAAKGDLFDLSFGIGQEFCIASFTLTPMIGWGWSEQHLHMYKGRQFVDLYQKCLIPGLNSRFYARWQGPWIGLNANYQLFDSLLITGAVEYHWVAYKGRGHWNLRPEFYRDFQQNADGEGVIASLGCEYAVTSCLSLGLLGVYRLFETQHGQQHMYILLADDQEIEFIPTHLTLPFRGAKWQSYSIRLYASYAF